MNRIPVGETIAFAYRFTFGHIGTVIGLIWIPVLVLYVAQFFLMNAYTQTIQDVMTGTNPAAAGPLLLSLFGFFFASIFLVSLLGVALTRQALGLRTGPAIVHFSLGAAEFNLFLSFLAAMLVVLAIYLGLVLLTGLVGGATGLGITLAGSSLSAPVAKLVLLLAIFAAVLFVLCVLLYIGARLTFLLAPVTVAEGKIDLIRAWTLTRGNFWRIFAVGLAIFAPIFVVVGLGEVAILGPGYFAVALAPVADQAANATRLAQQMQSLSSHQPMLLGLGMLVAPFAYGLMFAAPAYAYQKLIAPRPPVQMAEAGSIKEA